MIKYEFPVYPGDEAWYIDSYMRRPLTYGKGTIQMVGFTTRSVQIKFRNHKDFNKTYTWGKTAFATKEEAIEAMAKMKE